MNSKDKNSKQPEKDNEMMSEVQDKENNDQREKVELD
jgi:hypothetical protein